MGKDGFGDLDHEKPVDLSLVRPEHAVNAMYEFVCKVNLWRIAQNSENVSVICFHYIFQYPKQVDFLLVGPLTNFAMCISMYGSKLLDKVGEIYIMGGNYRGNTLHLICILFNIYIYKTYL